MLDGSKVAGILAESAIEGESVCYAVLGIGMNVAHYPDDDEEIAGIATSVNRVAGKEVSRESLLRQLLMELDDLYRRLPSLGHGGNSPVAEWTGLLDTIGKRVTATFRDERLEGVATGVDETGNLLLRLKSGEVMTLTAGDVTLSGSSA